MCFSIPFSAARFQFCYSGIAQTKYNSFRLQQLQTFQNASETYTYKNTSLKQILFLSSFYNPQCIRTHSHNKNTLKTFKNPTKSILFRTFSAYLQHTNFYIMQKIRFSLFQTFFKIPIDILQYIGYTSHSFKRNATR